MSCPRFRPSIHDLPLAESKWKLSRGTAIIRLNGREGALEWRRPSETLHCKTQGTTYGTDLDTNTVLD